MLQAWIPFFCVTAVIVGEILRYFTHHQGPSKQYYIIKKTTSSIYVVPVQVLFILANQVRNVPSKPKTE